MAKKFIKIGIILAVFSAIAYGIYSYKSQSTKVVAEEPVLKEQKVIKDDIVLDFSADGEADLPVTNLDFEIGGKLKEILVKSGETIKKGQIVAKLDDTDYINKINSAQIKYNQSIVKLEQSKQTYELQLLSEKQKIQDLKIQYDKAGLDYLPMLDTPDAYSEQELAQKKISYENAKNNYESQLERYNIISKKSNDIEAAEISVKEAEISLKIAKDDLNKTVLTSPSDGKVSYISYKVGESVPDSVKSDTTTADTDHFILLTDSEKVQVLSAVSEEDLSYVSVGQNVEVQFEAFSNKILTGKVTSIEPLPKKDNSGIVTYDVTIELDKSLNDVKTGMTCSVSFILKQKKNILIIPNKSVTIVDGKQTVQVKDEQGNIIPRTITTGLTDGKNSEVIEGLEIGKTLIIKEKN